MIVLDTTVISEMLRPRPEPKVVLWLERITQPAAITVITSAELLAGIAVLPDGRRRELLLTRTEQLLEEYDSVELILPVDNDAAYHYADVISRRRRAGRPIAMADAQIAAVCRAYGAALATRNIRDFEECGLPGLIDPWDAS